MTEDLSAHPFSPENIRIELGGDSPDEKRWLRWCAAAERVLGHDLGGNDVNRAGCGYSLDEALDYYESGHSAAEYAAIVQGRDRYRGERGGPDEDSTTLVRYRGWR